MDWWPFIFILVMIPTDSMATKIRVRYPNAHTQINRVIPIIPDRRFLEYDQNDPEQVMKALNSLPGPSDQTNHLDMAEYARIEKARIEKQRQKYPSLQGKRLPYENFDINKINQSAVYYLPNNDYYNKYYSQYYNNKSSFMTTMPTNYRKRSEFLKRRHHYDKGALKKIHEIENIPDLEAMLPPEYLKKHPHDFHRFHFSTGKNVEKYKNPYHNLKEPAAQYAEMGSLKKLRKSNFVDLVKPHLTNKRDSGTDDAIALHGITFRKSNIYNKVKKYLSKLRHSRSKGGKKLHKYRKSYEDSLAQALFSQTHPKKSAISPHFRNIPAFRKSNIDDRVEAYLAKKRDKGTYNARRYHLSENALPALTKEQVNHPGNSLFYITDKRILGAHIFPKKEAKHSLYGNLATLGLNVQPTSEELKLMRIKKIYRDIPPDAQDRPWRLYNRNHPGLNLLFEKKMPLDAAKFTKPKKFLVYGNLNNLGKRENDLDRYAFSDFRRSQYFKRLDSGRFNIRKENLGHVIHENTDNHHSRKPRKTKGSSWSRPGRKIEPHNEIKKKPKLLARIYIARSGPVPPSLEVEKKPKLSKLRMIKKKRPLPPDDEQNTEIKKVNAPIAASKEQVINKKNKIKRKGQVTQLQKKLKDDAPRLVYGNIENDQLGIKFDNTSYRWTYTDFRKNNENRKRPSHYKTLSRPYEEDSVEYSEINREIQEENNKNPRVIIVQPDENGDIDPETLSRLIEKRNVKYGHSNGVAVLPADLGQKNIKYRFLKDYLAGKVNENENEPNEIKDIYDDNFERWRRSSKGRNKYTSYEKKDINDTFCDNNIESSSSSESRSGEKNPGNPYTIFKNKYKQNWLWNHFMDGDHMNVNPYGPKFDSLGPTGHELFFGRKWWYFNQDDYKPFRRR